MARKILDEASSKGASAVGYILVIYIIWGFWCNPDVYTLRKTSMFASELKSEVGGAIMVLIYDTRCMIISTVNIKQYLQKYQTLGTPKPHYWS